MLSTVILGLVALAFVLIVIEDIIHVNKAKTTLFFGTLCWILAFIFPMHGATSAQVSEQLNENLLEIATLWLFLMSTMTFVAYLNSKGFIAQMVQRMLPAELSERRLMFIVAAFAFVFSSFADNVTATLVSIAVVASIKMEAKKLIKYATIIIFAVNSGGVSLITGDVTTLMFFLAGKVTIANLLMLVLPSFFAAAVLAILLSRGLSNRIVIEKTRKPIEKADAAIAGIFVATIAATLLFNVLFQIPPVLTFLFGLGIMFLSAQFLLRKKTTQSILNYVREVEFETLLFFLGVLLLVGILKEVGFLNNFTNMYAVLPPFEANYLMGIASSLIDNVPLTAALLKANLTMTTGEWLMLTYATGVGGSLLIIGSAAGIIAMSKIKELTFGTYFKMAGYLLFAYSLGYSGVYVMGRFVG
ncbi:MAG: sodium:proton antiporter NhaD [Gammaproteobacteria bacterium]|jgi:Na+/H+ antiporter NhaD/arsenite permease-like protein|nr:sodium:proton antiporter NhaD [Gammaproteobacteria bacterium]MBU2178258.1 sodium:proton antiporter NhaD [Gammaproteobacteria bacterium]MBU2225917.1 sodium:proton antiporter NhaD [Gammaproteobacteria bacterium]MBU2279686.1 sodium:proton antiporter NhaD [Gammaproteobacteria bacterium]MBU2427433.1 sodium:proton antiporter NhaD [Gammaproteobacteria bacterium]